MKLFKLLSIGSLVVGLTPVAMAGRIVLTGHDNDLHHSADAVTATTAELAWLGATASAKKILVIDNGTEAVMLVGNIEGAGKVVTKSVGSVTAADFDFSTYSSFVVASIRTCGGCDNPPGTGTALAAFSTSIGSFFNAGGGILGLTSAGDPGGFAYAPEAATGAVLSAFSGFTATANGLADIPGFTAVNGDFTHNTFSDPGTFGTSSKYKVAELLGAVIVSKFVICVAFAVGLDLFADHATAAPWQGAPWGHLIVGTAIICLAAFAPWVTWRLMPLAEAAVIAQGLSRAPGRVGQQAMQQSFYLRQANRSKGGGAPAGKANAGTTGAAGGATGSSGGAGGPIAAAAVGAAAVTRTRDQGVKSATAHTEPTNPSTPQRTDRGRNDKNQRTGPT